MDHSCLAERLARYIPLTADEHRALAGIEEQERSVPRGALLTAEDAPTRELHIVSRGWLYSSTLLADGKRQILGLHLPGELAGDIALPWARAPFALSAATDAVVHVVERARYCAGGEGHPRLALLIHMLAQVERAMLCDRLAAVGRLPAVARLAALIVDLGHRLRPDGGTAAAGFALPLTQEEIGDLIGLTAVHVNRMMRRLAEDGLIARSNGRIRLLDEPRLARLANHVDRRAAIDTSWLPPAAGR